MTCKVTTVSDRIEIHDYLDMNFIDDIAADVRGGLESPPYELSSKYFYDDRGSELFEEICHQNEYYQTQTEMIILGQNARSIMDDVTGGDLVELGAGANWKIRILLDALSEEERARTRYIPVDVSRSALDAAAEELTEVYNNLRVNAVVADFMQHMEVVQTERRMMAVFLGSTIGNLREDLALDFMRSISQVMKPEDRCLIGFDLVKDPARIEAAYNDARGVSAEFNRNILNVINDSLNADFNTGHFDHDSTYNTERQCIETYLRANRDTGATIQEIGLDFSIKAGERIHTEISRKFTRQTIEEMCQESALEIENWYTDDNKWYSIVEMSTAP